MLFPSPSAFTGCLASDMSSALFSTRIITRAYEELKMNVSLLAKTALLASMARPSSSFTSHRAAFGIAKRTAETYNYSLQTSTTSRFMMTTIRESVPALKHIGKEEMEDIVESLEQQQDDEDCEYVVIDVRGEDEIAMTGKLSPDVHTLPLPVIMRSNIFLLDDDEFEDLCHFPKPDPDKTLVFTCAAGIRSQQAAYFASLGGYSKLVNYMGGANEWFSRY